MLVLIFSVLASFIGIALFLIRMKRTHSESKSPISQNFSVLLAMLSNTRDALVEETGSKSLRIRFHKEKDKQNFQFSEVDGRLIVVWTLDSKVHGKRGKEWSFKADYDQEKMFDEISADLGFYHQQLFREVK